MNMNTLNISCGKHLNNAAVFVGSIVLGENTTHHYPHRHGGNPQGVIFNIIENTFQYMGVNEFSTYSPV